jgi:hypothetical protein
VGEIEKGYPIPWSFIMDRELQSPKIDILDREKLYVWCDSSTVQLILHHPFLLFLG